MKVLWLVNIVLPEAGEALKINNSVFGGWLTGALNGIRSRADITVAAVGGEDVSRMLKCDVDSVHYVVFPPQSGRELKKTFQEYLSAHVFDVIHVYGTEMLHSSVMLEVAPPEKTVINIQGLVSCCSRHYCEGLPERAVKDSLFKKLVRCFLRGKFLEIPVSCGQREMAECGEREIRTLRSARNVIGRTNWDRACVRQTNPALRYYHVNETLRDSFYSGERWAAEKCERHSIFLSQASYPIKGLHYFMQALTIIKDYYPNVHVYIGGNCGIVRKEGLRAFRDRYFGGYFGYINTYLADHDLFDCITLCGLMDEQKMAQRYRSANVFVCSSVIENSPNSVGEAMMLGTPVVAAYVGGIPDLLENGKEGLLYQASAPYMLADCVMRIFADDDLAMKLSANAIARAHITHNKKKNADALLTVYEKIRKGKEE